MKKKLTLVTALCIMLCGLAGCSGGNNAESTTTTAAETTTTITTAATEAETTTTTAETKEEAPAADGTVIYEANDIKITAGEFTTCKEYDDEPVLALNIVNNTGKRISEVAAFGFIDNFEKSMTEVEPVTVTYDASTVEKTSVYFDNYEEEHLSDEELAAGNYTEGDPIEVKITEDGEDGILLTLGTGEEYHLVPIAE